MEKIDFTNCFERICSYGGSEKKKKIVYDNKEYLLKFPDPVMNINVRTSYINNVYSEYIGCKVFESVGIPVQEVILGTYKEVSDGVLVEKVVVACKDFANDNNTLVEFSSFANSITSISKKFSTTIEDVYKVIDNIKYKCDKESLKGMFWERFVIDTLIGNTDRHLSDFGFFIKDDSLLFAPVYDCGSCLNPLLSDEQMEDYLMNQGEFKNIVYNIYPVYSYENKKITYNEFYNMNIEELKKAFFRIYPKIYLDKINNIIEDIPFISGVRKEFYKKSIAYRKKHILDVFYKKNR